MFNLIYATSMKKYAYLQPSSNFQTPQFYELPKVQFQHLPTLRPIHAVNPSLIQQTVRPLPTATGKSIPRLHTKRY